MPRKPTPRGPGRPAIAARKRLAGVGVPMDEALKKWCRTHPECGKRAGTGARLWLEQMRRMIEGEGKP